MIKEEVKTKMINRDTNLLKIDVYKVRYSTVVSDKFNSKKFKEENQDLYNSYTYKPETCRFEIR